jgi:hypothetical protein
MSAEEEHQRRKIEWEDAAAIAEALTGVTLVDMKIVTEVLDVSWRFGNYMEIDRLYERQMNSLIFYQCHKIEHSFR